MKIGIYSNLTRDIKCKKALELARLLTERGVDYSVCENMSDYFPAPCYPIQELASMCDMLVVFGGDGTMLSIFSKTIEYGTPLLGINMGNLGFLTECDSEQLPEIVDSIVSGKYTIEERGVLSTTFGGKSYTAVNEISLSRVRTQHVVDIDIYVDGVLSDIVTGDGVIVCTPTGSTAYAMSCGGAILSPRLKAMEITAICPHSLHSRPMVVSDESVVTLRISRAKEQTVNLVVDGVEINTSASFERIDIVKSDKVCKLVRINKGNFYTKLIGKMNNWNNICRRGIDGKEC